jgi:hypothetical protein
MNQKSTDDNDIGIGEARSLAMILPVVGRLRMAVGAENRDLAQRRVVDYRTHSARKSQGLLELNRLRMALATARTHPAARAALADLLGELDINRRLLHVQLRAAQTVSGILARAIRDGQSDGTYSSHVWRENDK